MFALDFAAEINEIHQDDDQITLQYGYMDLTRTVKLNLSEHPNDIVPSVAGDSIGWWEGDTLVVDTVGFEPGVLSPLERGRHVMNSDQLHVVERFKLGPDGQSLLRAYSATDAEYFIGSFAGENTLIPSSDNYVPYNCIELSGKNNQRPDR